MCPGTRITREHCVRVCHRNACKGHTKLSRRCVSWHVGDKKGGRGATPRRTRCHAASYKFHLLNQSGMYTTHGTYKHKHTHTREHTHTHTHARAQAHAYAHKFTRLARCVCAEAQYQTINTNGPCTPRSRRGSPGLRQRTHKLNNETTAWNSPFPVLVFWGKNTMSYAGIMENRRDSPSTTSI